MLLLEGIPISPGCASGIAVVYDYEIERRLDLPRRAISHAEVESECNRLDQALDRSNQDWKLVAQAALCEPKLEDSAAVSMAHSAMAKEIAALVKQHVGREVVNVERALDSVILDFVERLKGLDNAYLREREQDVRDVGRRMMRHLGGSSPWTNESLPPGSVIVARELMPSEAVELAQSGVVAIISEHGGTFSHTAIVARSLGIPAITGISNVTSQIEPGMRLLVDGETGRVVIAPSQTEEASFVKRKREFESLANSLAADEQFSCVTRDGIEISLLANIGLPEEVQSVVEHNLAGVGLFRTEFLFLESHKRPSFELQLEMYHRLVEGLDNRPLVIRTFDLGGDKLPPFLLSEGSKTHPRLHLRGLRFSLAEGRLLNTQLRAILQVVQTSDVRILFPMVIGSDDLTRAIATVDCVADQLGLLRRPPIGAMIETPAALFALDEILNIADFVAIGTNDLTQYMLAADRDLTAGTDDCTALHPAVLRAIQQVVEVAEGRHRPVCVCGEEAGNVDFACLLVGMGVRELSLSPARAAAVRHAVRHIEYHEARKVAGLALRCQTPQQVQKLVQQLQSPESQCISVSNGESSRTASGEAKTLEGTAQLAAAVMDQQLSLQDINEALERRIADGTKHLSLANQKLMAAEQDARLAAVSFDAHDSIVITDQSGRILRVNCSFTKLTGYAPEDVIGKTPRILRSGKHDKQFYREMWRAIGTDGYWEGEVWNKRRDGHEYLQRLTIAGVKNALGETTHYVGNGQDITQQKQGDADRAAITAARTVQRALFPPHAPIMPGFDIAGAVHPAERVSGDFFDYISLGQNSVGIVVGDVSGHGLGPALLMAQTQAYLRALAESHADPGELLTHANRLFATSDSGCFVTIFLACIDAEKRTLVYASAGHQGYLISNNGIAQKLNSASVPLGVHATAASTSAPAIVLNAGDILLIPTDGIEEATSPGGTMFGQQRVHEVVRKNRGKPAAQIIDALFHAAREFSEGELQIDDITAVVVKVLPTSPAETSAQPAGSR